MGPQNSHGGKHPDSMIKDFRALLGHAQDAMHCVAIYCGMLKFIIYKSQNKMYILGEQLHTMELGICHGIKVQLEGLEDERISQMGRGTGSQSWHAVD